MLRESTCDTRALLDSADDLVALLASRLTGLVGADGFRALLMRALRLATAEFPVLRVVRVADDPGSDHLLIAQLSNVASIDVVRFEEATAAVSCQLVRLLNEFLGPDLVQIILHDSWSTPPEA